MNKILLTTLALILILIAGCDSTMYTYNNQTIIDGSLNITGNITANNIPTNIVNGTGTNQNYAIWTNTNTLGNGAIIQDGNTVNVSSSLLVEKNSTFLGWVFLQNITVEQVNLSVNDTVIASKIGIGVSNPKKSLHILDNGTGTVGSLALGTSTNYVWIKNENDDYIDFFADESNAAGIKVGRIFIGSTYTDATYPLDVSLTNSIARFTDNSTASALWTVLGGFGSAGGKQVVSMTGTTDFEVRTGGTQYSSSLTGTTRLAVLDTGNVGIGTDNPSTVLYVNGSGITLDRSGNFGQYIDLYRNGIRAWQFHGGINSGQDNLQIRNGSTTAVMSFTQNGVVGIGTTAPNGTTNTLFDVRGHIRSALSSSIGMYYFASGSTNPYLSYGTIANSWTFADSSSYKMTINATSGYVGIGTTSPATNLEVRNPSNINAGIRISGSDGTETSTTYSIGNIVFSRPAVTSVNYEVQTKVMSGSAGGNIVFSPNSDYLNNTAVERMRIIKSGYVGINTTSPTQHLHVQGNVNVTGNLYVGGCITYNMSGTPQTLGVCV